MPVRQYNQNIHVIFVVDFSYPHGMAGTKRIQHAIDGIKDKPHVTTRVVVLRQSSHNNVLSGFYHGIPYETVMKDLLRFNLICLYPLLFFKATRIFKRLYCPFSKNIIYNYGPPNLINVGIIEYARQLGYKIIFDIVEDDDLTPDISKSLYRRIKISGIHYIAKRLKRLASGIIVISTHLHNKYQSLVNGKVPLHYRPVSVDFDSYPSPQGQFSNPLTLFYSGSFAKKDGVITLIEAFDILAKKYPMIRLVLTGRGSDEALNPVFARINISTFKDRIDYRGYLDDKAYYSILGTIDIPCMTRIDIPYAHAGFPFKLGEYLATGKPVIASRVSDVESFLKDRYDAMLIKPGDSSDIVAAVEYLIDHPENAIVIGQRGRDKAKACFDLREQGRTLISFMEQI